MRYKGFGETRFRLPATLLAFMLASLALPAGAGAVTDTFTYAAPGGQQDFVVPPRVDEVTIEACGAEGGDGNHPSFDGNAQGGKGGCATQSIGVTSGETLAVFVGGPGATATGGFNGGAGDPIGTGGGGGGGSDVRRDVDADTGFELDERLVVGGGGGGGGSAGIAAIPAGPGGLGGGTTGGAGGTGPGPGATGGGGGTQSTGGTNPNGGSSSGTFGAGGSPGSSPPIGGGGGGGYYGGAGGTGSNFPAGGGGGGGSSFPASATHEQGVHSGDGEVTISYTAVPTLTTSASGEITLGGQLTDTATLADGVSPTGQITFRLHGPGDPSCFGTPVFADNVAVAGNGAYTSAPFTPTESGTYRWVASYSGDADNAATTNACDEPAERVTVSAPEPPPGDDPPPDAPRNEFSFEGDAEIAKNGKSATLGVEVPGAGRLDAVDAGAGEREARRGGAAALIKPSTKSATGAGVVELAVKLSKAGKKKLKQKGKVKVEVLVTFTPTGGTAANETTKVKFKPKK